MTIQKRIGKIQIKLDLDESKLGRFEAQKRLEKNILELIKDYGESLIPKKRIRSGMVGNDREEWHEAGLINGFNEAIDQMRAKLNGDIKSL